MAAGDVTTGTASVAATTGTYDIKPGSGIEWVIHNIYSSGAVTLSIYDGTNLIPLDIFTGSYARLGMATHVTNAYWIRISNTGGSAVLIAYDGIQTK